MTVITSSKGVTATGGTHPWDELGLPFFPPLSYFRVDLVPKFGFDLASVTSKEREEALGPAVDHIDLVQGDSVDDFLAFLDFTLWALYKPCLHRWAKRCLSATYCQ